MLEFEFSCDSTLHEHAADLHSVDTVLEKVDKRQRIFAFVEVFTESFGYGVLCYVQVLLAVL